MSEEINDQQVAPVAVPVVEQAPKADPLAAVIAKARADREAVAQASKAKADLEAKYQDLEAKYKAALSSDFEDDPVGFAKSRGWTPDKQALYGQTLMYDLMPDKAPQDIRQRLWEAKQARKEAEQSKAAAEAQARAQEEANTTAMNRYAEDVKFSIPHLAGSNPESEAYFGDDHDTYHRSLIATAMNLAAAASKAGQQADLSPQNVAKVLEAELANRMKARDARVAARKPKAVDQQTQAKLEAPALPETGSPRGLTSGGAPRQPAMTEAERIQRAVEAGWRNR